MAHTYLFYLQGDAGRSVEPALEVDRVSRDQEETDPQQKDQPQEGNNNDKDGLLHL